MIKIKTNLIKNLTSKIYRGIENDKAVRVSELLELKVVDSKLVLAVTNTQFYLSMELTDRIENAEDFHVTVDADTFVKLVAKTTVDEISLSIENDNLIFNGNGTYMFPVELGKDGTVKKLPVIDFSSNEEFEISGDTLYSIYSFNSNELVNDAPVDQVQKYYYLDNLGCITYTESVYVNNFEVSRPFKVLINSRLAQLFVLFRGQKVRASVSKEYTNSLYENKIKLVGDGVTLVSYLPDDSMVDKYPATQCRNLQDNPYPGCVEINRIELAQALERLSIFSNKGTNLAYKKASKVSFTDEGIEISSIVDNNKELVPYTNKNNFYPYVCYMNIEQLKRHTTASNEAIVNVNYGNEISWMFNKGRYNQIIIEMENPNFGN